MPIRSRTSQIRGGSIESIFAVRKSIALGCGNGGRPSGRSLLRRSKAFGRTRRMFRMHRTARADASSFWTGCGAIRRTVLERLGGFDEAWSFMENVDLG